MTRATSAQMYRTAILKGIVNASKECKNMIDDDAFHRAPEYLLTVTVAKSLSGYGPVELEVSTKQTIAKGAPMGSGRRHKLLSGLKRFDIVCFERSREQLPRAIVEIKHPYCGSIRNLTKDIGRIAVALKTANKSHKNPSTGRASIRHGFLAFDAWFPSPKKGDPDAATKVARWIGVIEEHAKGKGVIAKGYSKCINTLERECQVWHVYAVVIAMKGLPRPRTSEATGAIATS